MHRIVRTLQGDANRISLTAEAGAVDAEDGNIKIQLEEV
jgi:hypothetical protein